jgi:virginiamycin B lyase
MSTLHPQATFRVDGDPDWMAVAEDAVWVSIAKANRVVQLRAADNTVGLSVRVWRPCSGLVAGFGSVWIPSCGAHRLLRADLKTGRIQARITAAPAASEGGIAVGAGSLWMATRATGVLARIDPSTNRIIARVVVPSGSYCPVFADGFLWITSTRHNLLSKIDPATNKVVAKIPVGPRPRFVTAGAGSVWTLNQGDGTISRVDTQSSKLRATIPTTLAGPGGEISFGFGSVWATLIGTPITRIDARNTSNVQSWKGKGGDSIRAGLGYVWLTDIEAGTVMRFSPTTLK